VTTTVSTSAASDDVVCPPSFAVCANAVADKAMLRPSADALATRRPDSAARTPAATLVRRARVSIESFTNTPVEDVDRQRSDPVRDRIHWLHQ
jgi:hypothetical protein